MRGHAYRDDYNISYIYTRIHAYIHTFIHIFSILLYHVKSYLPYPCPIKGNAVVCATLYSSSISFSYAIIMNTWKSVKQRSRTFSFTYNRCAEKKINQEKENYSALSVGTLVILINFDANF